MMKGSYYRLVGQNMHYKYGITTRKWSNQIFCDKYAPGSVLAKKYNFTAVSNDIMAGFTCSTGINVTPLIVATLSYKHSLWYP